VRSAAAVTPRLLAVLERIDDGRLPVAEIARQLGAEAERLGVPRPSYERVRQLVHELRLERSDTGPSRGELLFDVTTGLISRNRFNQEWDEAEARAARARERRRPT
jgi:hypothetical protein